MRELRPCLASGEEFVQRVAAALTPRSTRTQLDLSVVPCRIRRFSITALARFSWAETGTTMPAKQVPLVIGQLT